MKNTLETRLGIFVALVIIAFVLILEFLGGTESFRRGTHYGALFNNVQDLKVGDRVKMAGKEIGRVDDISLQETNDKVLVTIKVNSKVLVRTDSTVSIKFTGLVGQNFVSVDFGSPNSPKALEGTLLRSLDTPDMSEIMAKIDNVAGNTLWPRTIIESQASINWNMAGRSQWRTPEIVCDASMAIFAQEPRTSTGRQWIDEEALTELAGITNFDGYWCEGKPPERPIYIDKW